MSGIPALLSSGAEFMNATIAQIRAPKLMQVVGSVVTIAAIVVTIWWRSDMRRRMKEASDKVQNFRFVGLHTPTPPFGRRAAAF